MSDLANKRILLGVTGGIAAYKAAELTRLLVKAGADVRAVMTESACRFITPTTLQALSGNPAYTDMWDPGVPNNMAHIELSRDRDLVLVAPATADFLAKVAAGFGDAQHWAHDPATERDGERARLSRAGCPYPRRSAAGSHCRAYFA